jgi:CheY-specific phosphatase CheX
MQDDLQKLLDELVVECTQSLFDAAGIAVSHTESTQEACQLVGIIGFAGQKLRGVLGLSLSPSLGTRAVAVANAGGSSVDDWVAEAANQLLGRFKNKLLPRGVAITAALPIVLRGIEVRLAPRSSEPIRVYYFQAGTDHAVVWLDLQVDGEVTLDAVAGAPEDPMIEGDMMLF